MSSKAPLAKKSGNFSCFFHTSGSSSRCCGPFGVNFMGIRAGSLRPGKNNSIQWPGAARQVITLEHHCHVLGLYQVAALVQRGHLELTGSLIGWVRDILCCCRVPINDQISPQFSQDLPSSSEILQLQLLVFCLAIHQVRAKCLVRKDYSSQLFGKKEHSSLRPVKGRQSRSFSYFDQAV